MSLYVLKLIKNSTGVLEITYSFMANQHFHCRLDVKGCKQNLSSNIPTRNRSSSNAFQLAPYSSSSPRGVLERRTSQTLASTLKIVRSVSRESVRSIHHCTCPCLNAPVRCMCSFFLFGMLLSFVDKNVLRNSCQKLPRTTCSSVFQIMKQKVRSPERRKLISLYSLFEFR